MIVRTAPVSTPDPDLLRAMQRLGAQLRRAADDLAETLAAVENVVRTPLVVLPEPDRSGECGAWMPKARGYCARINTHSGHHRTRLLMDEEAERRRLLREARGER